MVVQVRVRDKDPLAEFLGWFSMGLGAAQVAAPKAMCRLVGADGDGVAPVVMRLMGLRELTQGTGILTRPRPTTWMWSRVGGDVLDLMLLSLVAAKKRRARTAFAITSVVGVMIPDLYESRFLSKKSGPVRSAMLIRKAVTISRPRAEVEKAWTADQELRRKVAEAGASVIVSEAPGDRGSELAVEIEYQPPAGDLGAAVQKLTGSDLATQLSDDLRRLKQRIETGEVVRSDGALDGHSFVDHLRQRPAQPAAEVTR
jgi:hypothetical protein